MRTLFRIILIICLGISLVACGSNLSTDLSAKGNGNDGYPITLTDQAGREITIEEQPQKIVSCYYITTSMLIGLGCTDRLVAIEDTSKKRSLYEKCAPEVLNLPSVGSPKEFDIEACVASEPDLVILPLRLKDVVDTLEGFNINVLFVNPESQEELIEMIELVSLATGTEDKGNELVSYITRQENMLEDSLKNEDRIKVYLSGNSSFLSTASKNMYQSSLIKMAGGINVADEIDDTYWATTSYEQILKWNPTYIILASDAKYTVDDVKNDPSLSGCEAIQQGNVYKIPSDLEAWDSPVPSGILGAVWLANTLHPEQINDNDLDQIIGEYYETFYGISLEK